VETGVERNSAARKWSCVMFAAPSKSSVSPSDSLSDDDSMTFLVEKLDCLATHLHKYMQPLNMVNVYAHAGATKVKEI
jgi:hypothetical protein